MKEGERANSYGYRVLCSEDSDARCYIEARPVASAVDIVHFIKVLQRIVSFHLISAKRAAVSSLIVIDMAVTKRTWSKAIPRRGLIGIDDNWEDQWQR